VLVINALDVFDEGDALLIEFTEESLCDALDIEGVLQAAGSFSERQIALSVQFRDVHDHRGKLADKQIARLTLEIGMLSGMRFARLTLHPIPEALRRRRVGEDKEVSPMT